MKTASLPNVRLLYFALHSSGRDFGPPMCRSTKNAIFDGHQRVRAGDVQIGPQLSSHAAASPNAPVAAFPPAQSRDLLFSDLRCNLIIVMNPRLAK